MSRAKRGMYQGEDGLWHLYDGDAIREDGSSLVFRRQIGDRASAEQAWQDHVRSQRVLRTLVRHRDEGFSPVSFGEGVQIALSSPLSWTQRAEVKRTASFLTGKMGGAYYINAWETEDERKRIEILFRNKGKQIETYCGACNTLISVLKREKRLPPYFPKFHYVHRRAAEPITGPMPTVADYREFRSILCDASNRGYSDHSWATAIWCMVTMELFSVTDYQKMRVSHYEHPFLVSAPDYKRVTPKYMNVSHLASSLDRLVAGKAPGALVFSVDATGEHQLSPHYVMKKFRRYGPLKPVSSRFTLLDLRRGWARTMGGTNG